MRVLLLTHYYAPETGAPQHRWSALARHLMGAGHELHVVAPSPHYPHGHLLRAHADLVRGSVQRGEHGETVHRVAFRQHDGGVVTRLLDEVVSAADAVRTVRAGLGDWHPDVVVATTPSLPMLWAGRRAARTADVPFVAELRDAWPDLLVVADEWRDRPRGVLRSRLGLATRRGMSGLAALMTREQRRADAVVTTTDTFAEVLRARGMPLVHVVRNAAHKVPGYPAHEPRRVGGGLHVLYAGTVGRAQGLSTAVRAAALVEDRGTPVVLRILGEGADLGALRLLAARLRAPVEFVPSVPRDEMAAHYAWADTALVSLRPWSALELTVPSKLYEVMALGLHVTAVVAGEAGTIVEGRHAGHVSPPGDVEQLAGVWQGLAGDRSLLELSALGREWVAEHAEVSSLGCAYVEVLQSVVTSSGR